MSEAPKNLQEYVAQRVIAHLDRHHMAYCAVDQLLRRLKFFIHARNHRFEYICKKPYAARCYICWDTLTSFHEWHMSHSHTPIAVCGMCDYHIREFVQ